MKFYPEGHLIDKAENKASMQTPAALSDAMRDGKILEARSIICDNEHNLIVDLKCMRGIIPREEGALGIREGTVRDIAIISRVNKPVCFIITDFIRDAFGRITAVLSRRKAQERCMAEYIAGLTCGDVIPVRITHLEPFGAFADIGCGIVSLLPIDAISVSRIDHPKERFTVGMDIRAVVRMKDENRITLSHRELLGTWTENAERFRVGETVAGIVRSVESYGIFVELTPNLAGLAELKENVHAGQQASVFIKSILPNRMKVKLVLVECFDYTYKPEPTILISSRILRPSAQSTLRRCLRDLGQQKAVCTDIFLPGRPPFYVPLKDICLNGCDYFASLSLDFSSPLFFALSSMTYLPSLKSQTYEPPAFILPSSISSEIGSSILLRIALRSGLAP